MIQNPYTVGTPVTGSQFYNREPLIEELIQFDNNFYFLNGIRRIGKTSILRQIKEILSTDKNIIPVYCSLQGLYSSEEMADHLQFEIESILESAHENLPPFSRQDASLDGIISSWVRYCKSYNLKSFLLIDEAEQLHHLDDKTLEKLAAHFASSIEYQKIILAGTRKFFQVESRAGFASFATLFKSRYIGHIDFNDVKCLISQTKGDPNATVQASSDQIETVYSLCGGHPFLIQHVCDQAWYNLANRHYLKDNIANSYQANLELIFEQDFEYLTNEQKLILIKLAQHEQYSLEETDFLLSVDIQTNGFIREIEELMNLGFIKLKEDKYVISYKMFQDWVREKRTIHSDQLDKIGKPIIHGEEKPLIVIQFAPDADEYFKELIDECIKPLFKKFRYWDTSMLVSGDKLQEYSKKVEEATVVLILLTSGAFHQDSEVLLYMEVAKSHSRTIHILASDFDFEPHINTSEHTLWPQEKNIPKALQLWKPRNSAYRQISEILFKIKTDY